MLSTREIYNYPMKGPQEVMNLKAHGTTERPVQHHLSFGCDEKIANSICSFNRAYSEPQWYAFQESLTWLSQIKKDPNTKMTYYDSVSGKALFEVPVGRTMRDFVEECYKHGWLVFHDMEVMWENVRVLANGETVSTAGTHLGFNIP